MMKIGNRMFDVEQTKSPVPACFVMPRKTATGAVKKRI